jgi:hypothetical protein
MMDYFQTRNPNLGKFWRFLQWKMMVYWAMSVYFPAIWYIPIMDTWYIFTRFGMLYQEKSGNPARPDLANFRRSGGSLLRAVFYYRSSANIWATFSMEQVIYELNLT